MDYAIKLWWENKDRIGDAVRSGDPRPIEAALRGYRDRVAAAGGVCYIDPPNLRRYAAPSAASGGGGCGNDRRAADLHRGSAAAGQQCLLAGGQQTFGCRRKYPACARAGRGCKFLPRMTANFMLS